MMLPLAVSTAAASDVKGGLITTSTPKTFDSVTSARKSLTYETVSAAVLNILKLPAIRGVRIVVLRPFYVRSTYVLRTIRKSRDARQFRAAEEFQRSAAAGRDVRHLTRNAGGVDRGHRIA